MKNLAVDRQKQPIWTYPNKWWILVMSMRLKM